MVPFFCISNCSNFMFRDTCHTSRMAAMDIPCVKKSFMVAVFMPVMVVTHNTSRRPIIHSVIVPT